MLARTTTYAQRRTMRHRPVTLPERVLTALGRGPVQTPTPRIPARYVIPPLTPSV